MGNRTDERELVEWELSSLSLRASLVSKTSFPKPPPSAQHIPSSLVYPVLPLHPPPIVPPVAHATWPLSSLLSRWRVTSNIPLNIRDPLPLSLSLSLPRAVEHIENGQDWDGRNPKPRARICRSQISLTFMADDSTVIVPAMFIEAARRPPARYARLIGALMSGPNERQLPPPTVRVR